MHLHTKDSTLCAESYSLGDSEQSAVIGLAGRCDAVGVHPYLNTVKHRPICCVSWHAHRFPMQVPAELRGSMFDGFNQTVIHSLTI